MRVKMNKEKEVKEIAEQIFQQGYVEGKRADIVAGVYNILTNERNTAGNPALAIRICDYVSDEVRKETAREILEYLRAVQEKDELKNCDLDWIAMQYGVEVEE